MIFITGPLYSGKRTFVKTLHCNLSETSLENGFFRDICSRKMGKCL